MIEQALGSAAAVEEVNRRLVAGEFRMSMDSASMWILTIRGGWVTRVDSLGVGLIVYLNV